MRVRPQRLLAPLLTIAVAGCGFIGSSANPRPDDPNASAPASPPGLITWSSLDWRDVTHEQPPKTSEEQWDQATAVAAGPGGWVAVGSNSDVMGYEGRIWHSADALFWELVSTDILDGLELVAVSATPGAFVAIGTHSANPNDPTTSILHSKDGLQWTEVETVDGAWAARVASGPRGFAVIVEVDGTNDLLLSPDGLTWTRVAGADIAEGVWLADIAWDGAGWIAAGAEGDRAVVLRSPEGMTWREEGLPASGPVDEVMDVSAYSVVPGRWATLLLGLDRGPSCAEDDDWCDKYQAGWSWTADTGWQRLPKSTWILDRGNGVHVYAAGDAGFLYLGDQVRTSGNGWDWAEVKQTSASDAFATGVVVDGEQVVAVGIPIGVDDGLVGWFGSALIGR
jgi:hypothetical protein